MSGKRAKHDRARRLEAGQPANGRSKGPNIQDNPDNRADRRLKMFHTAQLAAELRDTDPITFRTKARFWETVRMWLLMPAYREGLEDPHKPKVAK